MAKFGSDTRVTVAAARTVAAALDAATIDAEHLLLALAEQTGTPAARVLAEAGLDPEGIADALEAEFEQSLAAVGVSARAFDLSASPRPDANPSLGTSSRRALERAAKIAADRRDRRITPAHLLLGVLAAPAGTVPRALRRAEVDPAELARSVDAAL